MAHDYRCERCLEPPKEARLICLEATNEMGTMIFRLCADCWRDVLHEIRKRVTR